MRMRKRKYVFVLISEIGYTFPEESAFVIYKRISILSGLNSREISFLIDVPKVGLIADPLHGDST